MEVLWLELEMVLDVLNVLDMVLDTVLDVLKVLDIVLDTVLDVLKVLDIVLLEEPTLNVIDTPIESVDETGKLIVTDGVTEAVGVVTTTVQPVAEIEIVSIIRVTPPVRAYRPPWFVTSVSTEMLAIAIMSPAKAVPVPIVALLPTAQVTPQGWAPLIRRTADPVAVFKVVPIWNTH